MSAPYDHEALWLKAKLFAARAVGADNERTFDEHALWASLALELLAKASLARVSPLLIALPDEKGGNLLIASGLMEGTARFKTIPAHTLFDRCARAYKPFAADEAKRIAEERNDYLHGGSATFTVIPAKAWWPTYWAQVAVLVNALERDIEDLVGPEYVAFVDEYLQQNKRNLEHRLEMLLERAKQRLAQFEGGTLPARVAGSWAPGRPVDIGLKHSEEAVCPACSQSGLLEGDHVEDVEARYEQVSEDDFDVSVDLTVSADYFSCSNCGLVLDSYELLDAAELDGSFTTEGDISDLDEYEGEYGND